MKVHISDGVFVRHVADESVVWCPHTGGCIALRNAKQILDEVPREWRSIEDIVCAVATKFECAVDEVSEGVEIVIAELIKQKFVEVNSATAGPHVVSGEINRNVEDSVFYQRDKDEGSTPLESFYARHGLPSELHIDLTDVCNEKCVHCYLPKGRALFIDITIVFKVLKEFRDIQGLTVYVSGGECMLHKDLAMILRYARSLDLNIVILSNLTLCDAKMVALLKEIKPQFVNVSLYSVTESIHDSITQIPGSCRKTKAAIDALQTAGVHVRIATPFLRENKGCVDELRAYAAKRRVHLIADNEIFGEIDHSCKNQRHALSLKEMEELISTHKDVFAKGCIESDLCKPDAKVCDVGDTRLNLDAAGKYYPCDGFHGMIIGDASEDSLGDVWTGEALNKLRNLKNKDFGSCASCVDRAWCKVCPMRNFNETGDMFRHALWRCDATRIYRRIFQER